MKAGDTEWSVMSTGNHQGLVVDQDGKNIAVVYDKKDAPLLAAAPDLLEALEAASSWCREYGVQNNDEGAMGLVTQIDAAIAEAKGE